MRRRPGARAPHPRCRHDPVAQEWHRSCSPPVFAVGAPGPPTGRCSGELGSSSCTRTDTRLAAWPPGRLDGARLGLGADLFGRCGAASTNPDAAMAMRPFDRVEIAEPLPSKPSLPAIAGEEQAHPRDDRQMQQHRSPDVQCTFTLKPYRAAIRTSERLKRQPRRSASSASRLRAALPVPITSRRRGSRVARRLRAPCHGEAVQEARRNRSPAPSVDHSFDGVAPT